MKCDLVSACFSGWLLLVRLLSRLIRIQPSVPSTLYSCTTTSCAETMMLQGNNNSASRTAFPRRRSRGGCSSSAPGVDGKTGARNSKPPTANSSPQVAALPTSNTGVHARETSALPSPISGEYHRAAAIPPTPADSTRGRAEADRENGGLLTGFARQVVMRIGSTSRRRPPVAMACDDAVGVGSPEPKAGGGSCFTTGNGRRSTTAAPTAGSRGERSAGRSLKGRKDVSR
ncbi:unnamed protein product [Scytosiphon promiscuus]